jgi:hypothetical protein
MDASLWRPVVSGLSGSVITVLLMRRWAKTLPTTYASKPIQKISQEHRLSVTLGKALFFTGLCIGVAMYQFGGYSNHDLAPLAVGFGFACAAPIAAIWIISKSQGRDPREAFVAFSIGQGVPMWATYGSLGIFAFIAIFGAVKIIT